MTRYTDAKILEYTESPTYREGNADEWIERIYEHSVSGDTSERALERVYFASKRAQMERKSGLEQTRDMDHALLPVLLGMETVWVYADKQVLSDLAVTLDERARLLLAEMHDLVGETFNPLSAKQVQHILYEKLGIATGKKIKTGFSVDSDTLEEISKNYAIAGLILEYRGLEKLRSTYAEGLVKQIDPYTGRIHTTYNATLASTGRLSSLQPNLQNIPSGSGHARTIKSAFKPSDPDSVFLVADYSQVELRVLAMLSGDPALVAAFSAGEDIHTRTARFLFPSSTTISSNERRIAKSVNFGVIYGITGFGLSKLIKASPKDSTLYIERFFERYPLVRAYYDGVLENGWKNGFVETYYGRRRTIKWLTDANSIIRSAAEREAMNMPVQGTAADIMKLGMIEIARELASGSLPGTLLMQVHDELVLEVARGDAPALESGVKRILEWVLTLSGVELRVDIHTGANWADAKS
jgi:DNA polymerase I